MRDRDRLIVAEIPRLRRYARALTGDSAAANDLVEDCLERAWGRFHLWRHGSNLPAWMFTIMPNIHANVVRKAKARPRTYPLEEARAAIGPGQEGAVELRGLARSLAQLSDEQRQVILLVGLGELSYAEAAGVLSVPIGTVMSRLSRGRECLRGLMSGAGPAAVTRVK